MRSAIVAALLCCLVAGLAAGDETTMTIYEDASSGAVQIDIVTTRDDSSLIASSFGDSELLRLACGGLKGDEEKYCLASLVLEMEELLDQFADDIGVCASTLEQVADEAIVLVGAYEQCVEALDREAAAAQQHQQHSQRLDFWLTTLLWVVSVLACAAVSWKLGKACALGKQHQQSIAAQLQMTGYYLTTHSEDNV